MLDWIVQIARLLLPPQDHNPRKQFLYQLRVGIVVCFTFMGLVGITLAAFGVTPVFDGFAKSDDLKNVVSEIRQNRTTNVDSQLLELRIKHCDAKSSEAKRLYWSKIEQLLAEYFTLTGRQYQVPACTDL
jgi:hypothetical protein